MDALSLSWPAAVAILGSVVSLTIGFLTLQGKFLETSKKPEEKKSDAPVVVENKAHDQFTNNISALKDRVFTLEGELKVHATELKNSIEQLAAHEKRDIEDFKKLDDKVDKLLEIIVEMLKDDHQ